jgi:hypothetical protein
MDEIKLKVGLVTLVIVIVSLIITNSAHASSAQGTVKLTVVGPEETRKCIDAPDCIHNMFNTSVKECKQIECNWCCGNECTVMECLNQTEVDKLYQAVINNQKIEQSRQNESSSCYYGLCNSTEEEINNSVLLALERANKFECGWWCNIKRLINAWFY